MVFLDYPDHPNSGPVLSFTKWWLSHIKRAVLGRTGNNKPKQSRDPELISQQL
jgi:hypothetical protein